MSGPYRASTEVPAGATPRDPEEGAAHRGIRMRCLPDGVTEFRLAGIRLQRLKAPAVGAVVADYLAGQCIDNLAPHLILIGASAVFVGLTATALYADSYERILITPVAFVRRRFRRRDRHLLEDVQAIVVTDQAVAVHFRGASLAVGAGRDEASLRWLARRLRQAVERARGGAPLATP
jgi:hypothetical protein